MGEIADMMIDGTLDYMTGEYIGEGQGFPRTRRKEPEPVFGVKNYLMRFEISKSEMYNHCFGFYSEVSDSNNKGYKSWGSIASFIQGNWQAFVDYSNKTLKRRPKKGRC